MSDSAQTADRGWVGQEIGMQAYGNGRSGNGRMSSPRSA